MKKHKKLLIVLMMSVVLWTCIGGQSALASPWSFISNRGGQQVNNHQAGKQLLFIMVNETSSGKSLEGVMLASFGSSTKQASVIAIPKNMNFPVPGSQYLPLERIYQDYGLDYVLTLARDNLQAPGANYVLINLDNGAKIIDLLGGVQVFNPHGVKGYKAGWHSMNGQQLVQYSLIIDPMESSEQWAERQNHIMNGVVRKGLQPASLLRLPRVINQMIRGIETDLRIVDLLGLVNSMMGTNSSQTELVPGQYKWINETRYWVADAKQLDKLIQEFR